jgi:hypothetical protein
LDKLFGRGKQVAGDAAQTAGDVASGAADKAGDVASKGQELAGDAVDTIRGSGDEPEEGGRTS